MKKPATKKPKQSPPRGLKISPPEKALSKTPEPSPPESEKNSQVISPLKILNRNFTGTHIENIIHLSSNIILSLNTDHQINTINQAGCQALGCIPEEAIGKNWFSEFVTPSMRTSAKQSLGSLFSGEKVSTGYLVIPVIKKDGEERLVEWEAIAMNDTQGALQGVFLSGRDITQQKMVEKELIQSEWDMALAQKIARLGSWVYNLGTNRTRMSNVMTQIFGVDLQAFDESYEAFLDLIHPDDRQRVDESHQESFRTGKGHKLEYRVPLRGEGERIIYEESKVFLDDLDNPLKVRGIVQDITERKKVEEALRHSEQELSIAQKIGNMGNWVYDLQKNALWWSDQVYRVFGLRPREFDASFQKFLDKVHPEDRELVNETHQKILEGQKNYSIDHRIIWPDGSVRIVHQECETFYDGHGKPQKLRGIVQDITERKLAEQKLKIYQEQLLHAEKLSSIGKLTASIAHEINNPLFGIRNVLERTRMCVTMTDSDEKFIEMAIGETDRIAKLIRRLSHFFGPAQEEKERVQINHLLKDIILLIHKELDDRDINLITRYCDALPEIFAMPDQIKQVALNLLQNAMDALPQTGGEIILTTWHEDSHLYFSVRDNGTGITEETQKEMFEPFYTTKSKMDGTGLGLWVTKGILQSHGGIIEVDSQLDQGTTFTISLPSL